MTVKFSMGVMVAVMMVPLLVGGCRQKGWAEINVVNKSGAPVQDVKLIGCLTPEASSFGTVVKETSVTLWKDIAFDKQAGVHIEFDCGGEKLRQRLDRDIGFPTRVSNDNTTLELIYNGSLGWTWRVVSE